MQDHVSEGAEIAFVQHALDGFKDECDFAAAAECLFIGEIVRVFGFADPRYWKLAALDPAHVVRVLLGSDEFIVTAPNKVEEIVQKFCDIGGADEIIQAQLANVATQKDP